MSNSSLSSSEEVTRLDDSRRVMDSPLFESSITMLALGDWGKVTNQQTDVAAAMAKCAENDEIDVTLNLGDNFYFFGISSINDEKFKRVYEDVYNVYEALKNIPFWGILGNHDHLGNTKAQIEYSDHSTVWDIPSLYYSRSIFKDDSVILIALDTTPFFNDVYGLYARAWGHGRQEQLDWLLETLQKVEENDQRAFIIGHHPMYTSSTDGKTGNKLIRETIEQILLQFEKYIIAYVSGHEHVMCHYRPKSSSIDHFVSGSGCMTKTLVPPEEGTEQKWLDERGILTGEEIPFAEGKAGFFKFILDQKLGLFKAVAIDSQNTELYSFEKEIPTSADDVVLEPKSSLRQKMSLRKLVRR